MTLSDFNNIPFQPSALDSLFPKMTDIQSKSERLAKEGKSIRLRRGLYVLSPAISGNALSLFLIANQLYGPSYVSMQSALRYYGLIPERVYETISVTSKISKVFENTLGRFRYIHCSDVSYPIGITSQLEEGVRFLIATPEKALCDLIALTPNLNIRYRKGLIEFLEEDIRMEMDDLLKFDTGLLKEICKNSKKKNTIQNLIKIIEDERIV